MLLQWIKKGLKQLTTTAVKENRITTVLLQTTKMTTLHKRDYEPGQQ